MQGTRPVSIDAQRRLSNAQAGCSSRYVAAWTGCPRPVQHKGFSQRLVHVAVVPDPELRMTPFSIRPGYERLINKQNIEPDYDDPEWYEKVTDWDDFWNYTKWDMETEELDDEVDVSGTPTRTIERAHAMIQALQQIEARSDVVNIMPATNMNDHTDTWLEPPMEPETQDENPPWDLNDVRAFAEKQNDKTLMDLEWRRRQAKIGLVPRMAPERDVRLQQFAWENQSMDWSEEDVRNLITMNGTACAPEDHQAIVENPLIPVDFVNTMGVTHIEETVDLLERIGHLGTPRQIAALDKEVILDLKDRGIPQEFVEEWFADAFEAEDALAAAEEQRLASNSWPGDAHEYAP
mmetsp:Transcript_18091/g.30995  ORF Transcript_18091/g.30995 Transcript_18091/m.30995 type:complete len:349 (-) Transcript_18091:352-1398(-)|eukprot:CAMPEP_0119101460 /NCGR_PEP_ID=MMETSP1180-20130426/508_1 /TAXON_ID=3052 ORGANISM="Chlamydomonas cf sp, Strain CCMP681" /NCGR_SAMPLE_ID=MMETSP1180 /ASSEMBLY_ACC=CAM_ASM_000741 /LENGTH=348 /DNA_ID=CAMNT_0007085585 /DNA_START=90 /DNA_END=1136 /DNA_ORIENTATION=-